MARLNKFVLAVKLKQNGKLLSMYSVIIVIDLLYLKGILANNSPLANDIIKAFIINGATLPPICHKHVSVW